jgi:uncharacterized membrane protein
MISIYISTVTPPPKLTAVRHTGAALSSISLHLIVVLISLHGLFIFIFPLCMVAGSDSLANLCDYLFFLSQSLARNLRYLFS